jgi:hypothetical protein
MRNLSGDFLTETTAENSRPIQLFEGVFDSTTIRLWNGFGDLSWDSRTWLGNGWFQGKDGAEEREDDLEGVLDILLSGVPSTILSAVLGDQKQGALGTLYFGYLNSSGAVIANPYPQFIGKYSHADINESAEISTVTLHYQSEIVDMGRPKEFRWTNGIQQFFFSGDTGFTYVTAAANWHGTWGGQKQNITKNNRRRSDKRKGKR